MLHSVRRATFFAVLAASSVFSISAPAPALAQQSATVTRTMETTATVESADQRTRQLLLRQQDGSFITVVAGPEVMNLAQIKPGDRVIARYESALAARIGKPDQQLLSDRVLDDRVAAPIGAKPFGERDLDIRRRLKVTAIDLGSNTLSFLDGDGNPRSVLVRTPEMQAFLRTLKPGDDVDVAFREAAMVAVEPAR